MLYNEMKKVADYKLENYIDTYISFFEENMFEPMDPSDNQNWCWGKGTPILTDKGYKPIEEIKIGDMVYTHTGELKPVINTMSHFDENVCEIKGSGFFPMVVTKNHKLFVTPFDYMGNKSIKHYKDLTKLEIENINHKDLLHLFKNNFGNKVYDKNICYLVGRFVGDGYTTTQGGKSIVCAWDEVDELRPYFEKADIEYSIYGTKEKQTAAEFHIINSSKNEGNIIFLDLVKTCGIRAENKKLPENIYTWTKECAKAFLEGYMGADGYKNKKNQYRLNTVSKTLADELMQLIRSLGMAPTCYINKRGGESYIQGRKVNIKDRYEVYYYEDNNKSKYIKLVENDFTTYGLKFNDVEPQEVYNITVKDNHSYIAGGLISANCGGTGLMLACDPDGKLYPCLRYMPSSVGRDRDDYVTMGTVETGIDREKLADMQKVTRRSQSTDECFYCPIAKGCAWCFPAGTKIRVPNGFKNIEELQIGDEIIDMNGETQKVVNNFNHIANNLVALNPTGAKKIITTTEHPFWAKRLIKTDRKNEYGEPEWIKANDLKPSDRVALYVPQFGNKEIPDDIAYIVGRYLGDG